MTGSFADANLQHPPPHLPPQEQYHGAYGTYGVHPPLGSDSGSGSGGGGTGNAPPGTGYVPIPSGSFSPVTTNNNPLDHHHHMEAWNNNERLETSYY